MEALDIPSIAELGGQGKDRSLRKIKGCHGPTGHAFAVLDLTLNFSERAETSTWACFTLAGATKNAPSTCPGFARMCLTGYLKSTACLASIILASFLRYAMACCS